MNNGKSQKIITNWNPPGNREKDEGYYEVGGKMQIVKQGNKLE